MMAEAAGADLTANLINFALANQGGLERTAAALLSVAGERLRQEQLKKEGRFDFTCADPDLSDFAANAILLEEVGEVAREVLALAGLVRETGSRDKLRGELVQVAAVAVAWIEKLDGEDVRQRGITR
jgi:hypothetical protein